LFFVQHAVITGDHLMSFILRAAALSLFALPVVAATPAPAGEPAELYTRVPHFHVTYNITDDYSSSQTYDYSVKVLKEKALAGAKQSSISYSTSIEKAEVLSAYTLKADGRRIEVPKSSFQVETNTGKDKNAPVFSDRTTLTVVFPDVAVGDTVGMSYKVTQTEPMFPKHFSEVRNFSRDTAYDDVKVRVSYPAAMWLQIEPRELTQTANTESGGRKERAWSFTNPVPLKNKRTDYSVFDAESMPGLSMSTFKSYDEIAAAYGARATPKAAVTEQIKALADQIARDQKTPRDTARALYDWVATQITYAGNCIGTGAVVPHDLTFIIENKMGDCKDHATLLQALLAAKNIASTQALVNAGSTYKLAKVPVVSTVNHVINYLPAFDMYVDSTSSTTPFGMLPLSSQDKPVILVDGYKAGAKTPAAAPGSSVQLMKTRVKINDDGSASGTVEVDLKGSYAANVRASLREMNQEVEKDFVKNVLKGGGYDGTGKFDKDDPKELLATYRYKASFEIKNMVPRPGAGAFYIAPVFVNPAPVSTYTSAAFDEDEGMHEVSCTNGESHEQYIYTLPPKMKVLAVPDNLTVKMPNMSYEARYSLKGNELTVTRKVLDRTRGNVCQQQSARENKEFANKLLQNLKAQVVYK
jgi:transglutaminase-like putative cysteine protease